MGARSAPRENFPGGATCGTLCWWTAGSVSPEKNALLQIRANWFPDAARNERNSERRGTMLHPHGAEGRDTRQASWQVAWQADAKRPLPSDCSQVGLGDWMRTVRGVDTALHLPGGGGPPWRDTHPNARTTFPEPQFRTITFRTIT
eukprot:gene17300-biopygen8322